MPNTVAGLVSILKQYFAPASTLIPPQATLANRGNRTVSISTETTNPPTDSAVIQLAITGGVSRLVWQFKTQFNKAPKVTFAPIGPSPSGKPLYLAQEPTPNGCVVISEDATDTRHVSLHAIEEGS